MLTYQFDKEEHPFTIKSHANSKQQKPYRRTQDSTLKAISTKVVVDKPHNVFQSVAESSGNGGTQPQRTNGNPTVCLAKRHVPNL